MAAVDHVVLIVFDGLRPDMVGDVLTPNIMRLARRGVWFREARSVFPSMTRVATTSIATGALPSVHGVVGNSFYWPQARRDRALDTSRVEDLALLAAVSGGEAVAVETFGDRLARAGKRLAVVHTGSAGSAWLINPRARANRHWTFSVLGEEHTQTPEAVREMVARFGPLPPRALPRFEEIDYAATAMVEHVLPVMAPDAAVVWFNEPDTSFHYRFIGSPESNAILGHVDAALGRILDWIDAQPNAERYAVIAASDHGHIATSGTIDLAALLSEAGHPARPSSADLDGAALSWTGGTMGEIRILDGDAQRRERVARWLMEQSFVGHVLSSVGAGDEGDIAGTLPLSLVGLDHARRPDLAFVLRSTEDVDAFGWPGSGLMTGGVPIGGGMHGGFNRYEQNTLLIGAGAGWREENTVTHAPAGIVDLAPTILDLLDVPAAETMVGRSLRDVGGDEGATRVIGARHGSFSQSVTVREARGRRFLMTG